MAFTAIAAIGSAIGESVLIEIVGSELLAGAIGAGIAGGIYSEATGGDFGQGFLRGGGGKLLGAAIGSVAGGIGEAAGGASAESLASFDAAQLAAEGLSESQIADILGQSYGDILGEQSLGMLAENAFTGATPEMFTGAAATNDLLSGEGFVPGAAEAPYASMSGTEFTPQNSSFLGDQADSLYTEFGVDPLDTGISNANYDELYGLENINQNIGGNLPNLPELPNIQSTGTEIGSSPTGGYDFMSGDQPTLENIGGGTQTAGGGLDYPNTQWKSQNIGDVMGSKVNKLGKNIKDIFGDIASGNEGKGMPWQAKLGVGAFNTLSGLYQANKMKDMYKSAMSAADPLAGARSYATDKWQGAYDDPEALFREYMSGPGTDFAKQSTANYAKLGRRGSMLPQLMNQTRQNFYSNYLPQYRTGVNPAQFGSGNAGQVGAAMAENVPNQYLMALSNIPRTLGSIYSGAQGSRVRASGGGY
jgi:hypothetical protein